MPSGYNHITVIGHLGQDPELRFTPQGNPICSFTMAVNSRKKIDGEWNDIPLWFKIKVWGRQAEPCSQYLSKGRPALIAGQLEVENWVDRDGKDKTTLVINASAVQFLGDGGSERSERPQRTSSGDRPRAATPPPSVSPSQDLSDDDIPF